MTSVACGRIHQGHERFSDDPQGQVFGCSFTVFPGEYSLPVEVLNVIVELYKYLPLEVNNSTIELHLPVDSQYFLSVEGLNLIVKSKSIKSFFTEIIFFSQWIQQQFFFYVLGKNASIRSKLPTDLNIESNCNCNCIVLWIFISFL